MRNQFSYTYYEYGGGYSYIVDQKAPGVGDKTFGLTTVSHGGCGPVSAYNASISLGCPKRFCEVLDYFDQHFFQLNVGGLVGTMPNLVAQYFRDLGYTVYMTDIPDEIDILSQSADACIMWYMFHTEYAFGAHFVEYSSNGAGYIGRNTGGNGTASFIWPSDYAYQGNQYYGIGIFIYK